MGCSCNVVNKVFTAPKVFTTNSVWNFNDYLGSSSVRMSINRNNYSIEPGLYKLGNPDDSSDILVSANYKLSFDTLRKNLSGLNIWILVLDTKGVNVWCAAGKGTFGTAELIDKVNQTDLHKVVKHRRLILPQLGAPGIAAHQVTDSTGFKVKYGPVRAKDIKSYISSGYKADEQMRTVNFNFMDRLLLTPVEIANSLKYLFIALLIFSIISGLSINEKSLVFSVGNIIFTTVILINAYLAGAFFTPIFLPWIPSRYFAAKGLIVGAITFLPLFLFQLLSGNQLVLLGWLLVSMAISSFLSMNFTGASTYTSLSGVKKEMKLFVPIQLGFAGLGMTLVVASKFLQI
ncbi:MAG: hypothetical protein KAK04_08930 [Cyclobacteriaceae bacterium]|nr:hypothetical protein [Cyclobacteriaceae bacterium]